MNLKETEECKFSPDWWSLLDIEFNMDYMKDIYNYLIDISKQKVNIYPSASLVYKAFELTHYKDVRVCILGQDPYHTPGAAMGLAFSVPEELHMIPPSLRNIFAEIENDVYNGLIVDQNPDLTRWAKQGVFLLNTTLTVEKGMPASHDNIGWRRFTQTVVQLLAAKSEPIVFIFWGNHAREYKKFITNQYHLLLEASHPSPFSVSGFKGCKHFSKTNDYLVQNNIKPINW